MATERLAPAAATAAATFAFLAFFYYARPLSYLPAYPAVLLALAVWTIAPGWLLQRSLTGRSAVSLDRLALAFLCSVALSGPSGLVALQLHASLAMFAMGYAVTASLANGAVVLFQRDRAGALDTEAEQRNERGALLLMGILAVGIVTILLSPVWAADRISRDFDTYVYMSYVNHYMSSGTLNSAVPYMDQAAGAFDRLDANVWAVLQALVGDNAGVSAYDLMMDYLPPATTVLAVTALFALARGVFRNRIIAPLAAVFALVYATIDLSSYESYGRNLFLRIAQDKLVATFVLLPIALLFACDFLVRRSARGHLAVSVSIAALFVVHPMGAEFLLIAVALLAATRAFSERSLAPARAAGLLLLPWFGLGLLALAMAQIFHAGGYSPGGGLHLTGYIVIVRLGHGLIMGNYHLLLHPFVIAAVLLAPIVWLAGRREIGGQLILATTAGALVLFFVPIAATPLAYFVSEQGVWRLPWMIPVPLTLAYASSIAIDRLRSSRALPSVALSLAPVAAILVVAAAAFVVQEYEVRADGREFFIRVSSQSLLPWTGGSVERGGVSYAFDAGWRQTTSTLNAVDYLDRTVPEGSTMLVPPDFVPLVAPMLPVVQLADGLTTLAFYHGDFHGDTVREALRSNHVDSALIRVGSSAFDAVRLIDEFNATDAGAAGPGLAVHQVGDATFPAWTFGAADEDQLSGRFTVPGDIDPEHPTLDLDLAAAPSAPVDVKGVARLHFSAVRADLPAGVLSQPVSGDIDVKLAARKQTGSPIPATQVLSGTLQPGATYSFTLSRVGGAAEDSYRSDLWLYWVKLHYWPDELTPVPGSFFYLYTTPK